MALTQGLIDSYWRKYNQRRALTGLPASYQEQRGMLDPMMESVANKDIQEAQLRYQNERSNRQLSLQEQAQKDSARAANISGVANIGQLGLGGYLGYKYLTKPPSALENALAAHYGGGAAGATASVTSADITAAGGMFSAPSYTAPALSAPGYTAPTLAGAGSGGAGILAGAGSGVTAPSAAYTGATGTAAYGSAEGAGTASVLGAEGASAGILSTIAPPALGWAAGSLVDMAINKWSPVGGAKEKSIAGNIAKGAGVGAGVGSVVPGIGTGVGAVVGGVIGGAVGLIEDVSVICSELQRQGEITEKQRTACVYFRFRHIPNDMFMAYLEWAEPIVKVMRKGGIGNRILLPFAHAFIGYMLAVQEKRAPSFMERMVWKYAWWRCEKIAQLTERFAKGVSDGHAI